MSLQFLSENMDIRSSMNNGSSIAFNIENKTNKFIEVYWINREGLYVSYGSVAPMGVNKFNTFKNHPWLIKTDDYAIKFFPDYDGIKGTITLHSEGPIFTSTKEVIKGGWSTFWGYGIPDVAKALKISDNFSPLVETKFNNHDVLNMLNIPAAWSVGLTGKGIKVAVLDGGIVAHPEIQSIVNRYNALTKKTGTVANVDDPYAFHGLGTAAVIGAKYDSGMYTTSAQPAPDITGVAPDVDFIDIRVTHPNGNGSIEAIANGITYAVAQGAKVIHISQGNSNGAVSQLILDAVRKAYDQNVLVVWPAHNGGQESPTGLALSSYTGTSISVGNYNFNSGQPHFDTNLAGPFAHPFFFAPSGGYYPIANGEYKLMLNGGTSFSSPYISGIAALLFQKYPDATVSEIIELIQGSAWIPSLGRDILLNANGNRIIDFNLIKKVELKTLGTDIVKVDAVLGENVVRYDSDRLLLTFNNEQHNITGADRVKFNDKALAFDMDGAAGDALEIMFALTQKTYFNDPNIVGLLLQKLDTQNRNEVLKFAALNVLGPNWDGQQLIATAAKNIYGLSAQPEFVDLLLSVQKASGISDLDFFWHLAESEMSHANIGLIGIQTHGLEYIPTYG